LNVGRYLSIFHRGRHIKALTLFKANEKGFYLGTMPKHESRDPSKF